MRENIKKLYANMRKKPAVSMETYRIIQETYKAMTGQPMIKCRTEAFHNIMAQIPVFIEKGDIWREMGPPALMVLKLIMPTVYGTVMKLKH